jgi:transposase-like protein
MKKIPKQAYTVEFKELAVKRVKAGQSIGVVIKELGLGDQTLRNWIKAFDTGKLSGSETRKCRNAWKNDPLNALNFDPPLVGNSML